MEIKVGECMHTL